MRVLPAAVLLCAPLLAQGPPCAPVAEPAEVRPGESVLLSWDCPAAAKVRLEPGGLILGGKGRVTLRPTYTTTYRIFEARGGGAELGAVEVRIVPGLPLGEPARVCSFDASSKAVLPGEPVVLRWECTGSAKVRLEPGGLELDGQSSVVVVPTATTVYTLNVSNAVGGASRSLEVQVAKPRRVLSEADLDGAPTAAAAADPKDPAARLRALQEADLAEAFRLGQALRAAAKAEAWTLRLVVSGSAPGLKSLARAAGAEGGELMVLPYLRRDGFRWWQACWGAFPSRAEALKAWTRLPEALRKGFPEPLPLKLKRLPGDPPPPAEAS